MKRGTTPSHVFDVDVDLTGATVYISYEQDNQVVVEKTNPAITIEPNKLTTTLTQEETLRFRHGIPVNIQIRYNDGIVADASDVMTVPVERILKEGII